MTLPIPPDEQLDDEEWRSLIHLVREYQNDTDDDDEFIFWDTVIDKLYIYQEVQFTDTHKNDD